MRIEGVCCLLSHFTCDICFLPVCPNRTTPRLHIVLPTIQWREGEAPGMCRLTTALNERISRVPLTLSTHIHTDTQDDGRTSKEGVENDVSAWQMGKQPCSTAQIVYWFYCIEFPLSMWRCVSLFFLLFRFVVRFRVRLSHTPVFNNVRIINVGKQYGCGTEMGWCRWRFHFMSMWGRPLIVCSFINRLCIRNASVSFRSRVLYSHIHIYVTYVCMYVANSDFSPTIVFFFFVFIKLH